MKSYLSRLMPLTLAAIVSIASPVRAEDAANWAQWRGPNYDGSSPAKNLPTEFGKDKNLLWAAKLPGISNATPIVYGDRVFTTSIDEGRKMAVICLSRADGKVLWQKDAGTAQIRPKGENDVAAPSPVTDGKTVVFMFGTGDILAFDVDGKPLWARNLQREIGEWNINWIYGSSPTLHKGKLYVQVLHTDKPYAGTALPGAIKYEGNEVPSYLLALDPLSGKELFRVVRPTDAVQETKESYATPIPYTTKEGREEILIVGGDAVTGHDPVTGKEIWRYTGWDPKKEPFWRLIPSVGIGGGMILACAPKNGPVMGIKEGGVGDVSTSHHAWKTDGKEISSDVPVPLYYQNHFYILDHGGTKLTKVVPATGAAVWVTKLEGVKAVCRASPTGADGKIYCMNVNGDVWVVSPEDGKILSKTALGGNKSARGTVAVVDGMLLIREGVTLYAFGVK
ncbi:outer membrane protein assembly factor BamB family protein [Humisphaera borealis]|uniref:PQQ-binding-like beta-propeller repeat protein n=1 Tax=Humisphaera borealis TaxID=2807512 RepID=A0A7M2WUW3_9BACT|nr:PQQ-binding-like beta-propeller repeat protein [Humisphaera borealis]QOV89337.1 PQQ-binding-like beta-propeller repeat protein [Humisphaera borealis]